jgi:putative membrane protein
MRYPAFLLAAFLAIAVLLGIAPWSRADWALENAIAVVVVTILVLTHRRMPLSRVSTTLIFIFLVLHEVGAHYTYSEVPYDAWAERLTGATVSERLGLERNHYDRVVHLAYGFLLAYPFRELFVRVADARGFWGYFLPLDVVMSTSMLYELLEWLTAGAVGEAVGNEFLGAQGDVWDAQWDMLLATLGAAAALAITACVHRAVDRDFQKEWAESLRVKDPRPLGEQALRRASPEV